LARKDVLLDSALSHRRALGGGGAWGGYTHAVMSLAQMHSRQSGPGKSNFYLGK